MRQAIIDANASVATADDPYEISFSIANSGVNTITLQSQLPTIIKPVTIDGTTQAGSSCGTLVPQNPDGTIASPNIAHQLNIVLTTSNIGADASVIRIGDTADRSTIQGLVINGAHSGSSSNIWVDAQDVNVSCNYIGTNQVGDSSVVDSPNGVQGTAHADGLRISNNLISGNMNGIHAFGSHFVIEKNLIGTDATGTKAIGNTRAGINLSNATSASIYKNVISGNQYIGLRATGAMDSDRGRADDLVFRGNNMGTDITGLKVLSNRYNARVAGDRAVYGGSTPDDRNIIGGNTDWMNFLMESSDDTKFQGNYVGVGADEKTAIGGASLWMVLYGGNHNIIGGSAPGEGNVIGGLRGGGLVFTSNDLNSCKDTLIEGNYIGVNRSGDDIGNGGNGIGDDVGCKRTQIKDNRIQNNQQAGIYLNGYMDRMNGEWISSSPTGDSITGNTIGNNKDGGVKLSSYQNEGAHGNTIRKNAIWGNGGIGIDLSNDGVTTNDNKDEDDGINGLQNYPTLGVSLTGCDGKVQRRDKTSFNSSPNTTFTLDWYSNPSWTEGSGAPRQGEKWITSTSVTTDENGDATITIPQGLVNPSATATDPDGNTSEFGSERSIIISDCSETKRYASDTMQPFSVNQSWNAQNLPHWGIIDPKDPSIEVAITVDGKQLIIDDPDKGAYVQVSADGWYARGYLTTKLAPGSYDVAMTITDKDSGLSMTKSYKDALSVVRPKISFSTVITNNQTPTLNGAAEYVYLSGAYILKRGEDIATYDGKPRVLRWQSDSSDDSHKGRWIIITSAEKYEEYIRNQYEELNAGLAPQLANNIANWVADPIDVEHVSTKGDLLDLYREPAVQDVSRRYFSSDGSEQGCCDEVSLWYDGFLENNNQSLESTLANMYDYYSFDPLPEGEYDIYFKGYDGEWSNNDSDSDIGMFPVYGQLIVDLTAPQATIHGTVNGTAPTLTGSIDVPTATVYVTINGRRYKATNTGNGSWILPPVPSLVSLPAATK